jgi:hypothetical protein
MRPVCSGLEWIIKRTIDCIHLDAPAAADDRDAVMDGLSSQP